MDKPLSHKRLAFVEEYCVNGHNAAKAYAKAYPDCEPAGCETHGPRLVRDGQIKQAISERMAELRAETGWSVERSQSMLLDVVKQATALNQPSAAVSGLVAVNRLYGLDASKVITEQAESMTQAEAEALAPLIREAKLRLSKSSPDKELKTG